MAKRKSKKSSKEVCHVCYPGSSVCLVLCGVVCLVLAFLLWKGLWGLNLVVAVLLAIFGLKELYWGLKG